MKRPWEKIGASWNFHTRVEDKMFICTIRWLKFFAKSDDGVTAIEYALMGGLISVAIIVALSAVGDEVQNTFDTWTGAVQNAVQNSQST